MSARHKIWYLKSLDLFKGLSEKKVHELESLFTMRQFCRGEMVSDPDRRNTVFIVKSGKVDVYQLSEDGRKYIIDVLTKGSVFGDVGSHTSSAIYAESREDSYVCWMNKEQFFKLVSANAQVSSRMMRQLFERLLVAEEKAASLASDSVLTRLAKLLLNLGKPSGGAHMTTDSFTHESLAQMLGISRQTVTTLLKQLEKDGAVTRQGKQLVYDKSKLAPFTK